MKEPDSATLVEYFRAIGGKLRMRKSGRVHTLDLSQATSEVDNAIFEKIVQLKQLEILDLSGSGVSDDAIESLVQQRTLKLLTIVDTDITADALSKLRKNMVGCRIVAS